MEWDPLPPLGFFAALLEKETPLQKMALGDLCFADDDATVVQDLCDILERARFIKTDLHRKAERQEAQIESSFAYFKDSIEAMVDECTQDFRQVDISDAVLALPVRREIVYAGLPPSRLSRERRVTLREEFDTLNGIALHGAAFSKFCCKVNAAKSEMSGWRLGQAGRFARVQIGSSMYPKEGRHIIAGAILDPRYSAWYDQREQDLNMLWPKALPIAIYYVR
jgi:hypothetical protein